jgi:two-component system, cell cycle sensor histidine kinase and response regulator CckA
LSVHTKRKRIFTQDDTHFLQAAANVLTEAIQRKRSEQALRESEEKYRTILENIEDGYFEVDIAGNFTFFNDAMCKILSYSRDELMGMNNREYSDEENSRKVYETFNRVHRTGEPARGFDWQIIRKDGGVRFVEASVSLIKDPRGRPTGFRGIVHDITERKRAEEEILFQKARFQQLFENAPLGILRVDQNDIVLDANKEFESIFQFSLSEMRGRSINEIVVPKAYREEGTTLSSRALQGEIIDQETIRQRKDGTLIPVQIYGLPIVVNQQPVGVFAIYVDLSERKRAEEALKESQEWLTAIFDSSRDGIIVEENEHIVYVNQSYAHSFGYEPDELMGQPVWLVSEQEPSERMLEYSRRRMRGEEAPSLYEFRGTRKDGRAVDLEASVSNAKIGDKTYIIALCRDSTERKRAEDALHETNLALSNAMPGISILNSEGRYERVNEAYAQMLGYPTSELIGAAWTPTVALDDRKQALEAYERMLSEGKGEFEARAVRKDGSLFYKHGLMVKRTDADGKLLGHYCFMRDITERKRMEQEREVIFEIIQGVIATANLDELLKLIHHSISKIVYAENCFVALHDPKTDLLSFEFWVDKFDPAPPPRPVGIGFSSYVLRTGKPILLTKQLTAEMVARGEVTQSGTSSPSWLGVQLRTPSRTIGVLAVQHYEEEHAYSERDLEFLTSVGNQIALAVERKRTEQELRISEEQLRQSQKMESIGTLAGGIAHDFNNLMTAVNGYSELALRSLEADNPVRSKIEEIKKAGERAAALTSQLLAFSRKQILQPKVLDLNSVITAMGKMLTRVIGEDFDLKIELDASLDQVEADPGQVEQILLNLAVNARDAMLDGGYLTIKTENVHFDRKFSKRRSVVEPGHYVMLSVSDNGCGMDAETQTHIFEPFFTTKEIGKGTGLGLSTVYGIVKQSGGSIWVYSEVGKGTIFKIYLPRVDNVVETEESADKSRSAPRGSETILLVEDEEMVRDLSKEILEEYGYAVITAPNGKEGLRICKEFEGNIDLMITDVVMPQMSGRQLAESIGALRPDTRVLYMSGYTDQAIVRHGVLAEGVCFIQKPFSPDSLAVKAREVLDQNGSR